VLRKFLQDASVYFVMLKIDEELAAETQHHRCPQCQGTLHVANYPRKPRALFEIPPISHFRFSFCCSREGCRQRQTPRSVRFLDHKVYLGIVVTLVAALEQGIGAHHLRLLHPSLGIDRRTLNRWQQWWHEVVPRTKFWRWERTKMTRPADDSAIAQQLVERFTIHSIESLMRLLIFLSPLSVKLAF
jgi:hypothetical protein